MLWMLCAVIVYSLEPDGGPPFSHASLAEWAASELQCEQRLAHVLAHPRAQVKAHAGRAPTAVLDVVPFPAWRCRPVPFER